KSKPCSTKERHHSTKSPMEPTGQNSWRWGRSGLALFLAIVFLAVQLPKTGRTEPPKTHIVWINPSSVLVCGMAIVPLLCIVAGIFSRRPRMEIIGWVLIAGVITLMVVDYVRMSRGWVL